jgi:hypothetical protein
VEAKWKPNFTHAHRNYALQISFSLIMTPSLQGLPYWENGPLRKNSNTANLAKTALKKALTFARGGYICNPPLFVLKHCTDYLY